MRGMCVTCGGVLSDDGVLYCSKECWSEKTPAMIELEKKFEKPIRKIVVEMLNSTMHKTDAAEMLNITVYTLNEWIKKFDIEEFHYFE